MQRSPALIDGTQALTTAYHEGPTGPTETRYQQQQREVKERAKELQKRYDYVNVNTSANIGSKRNIIQERPQQTHSLKRKGPAKSPLQASIKNGCIPMPTGSPLFQAGISEPLLEDAADPDIFNGTKALTTCYFQIKPEEESREQKHRRKQDEAVAKAAALKKQYKPAMLSKGANDTLGSRRNIIQERASQATVQPAQPKETKATITMSSTIASPADSTAKAATHEAIQTFFPTKAMMPPPTSPPRAPPDTWQAALPEHQMDQKDLEYLQNEGYPYGLIQAMTDLKSDFAKQIWIVDNSESMTNRDGTMLADVASGEKRFVHKACRWDELRECVSAHIRLSGALRQPTSFRLLNDPGPALGPQRFGICESALSNTSDIQGEVENCLKVIQRNYPVGQTPLLRHIKGIIEEISEMRAGLLASGKRVAIVICTDGVPTDAPREQFLEWLRKLEALPVWLVVRLCTNEPNVVDFYNKLDEELKISVDVIDDFQGEALDICKHNPWLTYALPLHRARERGFHARVLDFLDECPLSKKEQKEVCGVVFGRGKMEHCPDPDVDPARFRAHVDALQEDERLQWDPIKGKVATWVDFVGNPKSKLRRMGNLRRKKTSSFFSCFGM